MNTQKGKKIWNIVSLIMAVAGLVAVFILLIFGKDRSNDTLFKRLALCFVFGYLAFILIQRIFYTDDDNSTPVT